MAFLQGVPEPLRKLMEGFKKLPGIGRKTATRLSLYLINKEPSQALDLAEALKEVVENINFCNVCNNLTEQEVCDICQDPNRNKETIMVVEQPNDLMTIEMYADYNGLYHILGGYISPLDGVTPSDLNIKSLMKRIRENEEIEEIIIATNPSTEGDATATYLTKLIKAPGIKVTRLAQGLPSGSSLQFADKATLSKAIKNRKEEG